MLASCYKFLCSQRERLGILAIGLTIDKLIGILFDYTLYPFVIWQLGILRGGLLMTALTFLYCYLVIIFYDWSKKDWLGVELVREKILDELRNYRGSSKIKNFFGNLIKKGEFVAIFLLSLKFDAAVVTICFRNQSRKMGTREWCIFTFCVVFGNCYWLPLIYAGVKICQVMFT